MKNIHKYISTAVIALMAVFISSCLKDDSRIDFSNVGEVIEMLDAQAGVSTALNIDPNKDTVIIVRVNQTGSDATSQDIVVTLGVVKAGLDLYNLDTSHVPGSLLPDSAFSYPATVTIKAGKDSLGNKNRTAEFPLTIHTSKVPVTAGVNYVLPIGALSTSPSLTVSGNFGAILYNFYHNPYDGFYKVTGTMVDVTNPKLVERSPLEFQLVTVNATQSTVYSPEAAGNYHPITDISGGLPGTFSYYGSVGMKFTFDSDNNVTKVENVYVDTNTTRNRTLKLDPSGINKYDPATKTLRVKYIMHQDDIGDRTTFDETWVFDHN